MMSPRLQRYVQQLQRTLYLHKDQNILGLKVLANFFVFFYPLFPPSITFFIFMVTVVGYALPLSSDILSISCSVEPGSFDAASVDEDTRSKPAKDRIPED